MISIFYRNNFDKQNSKLKHTFLFEVYQLYLLKHNMEKPRRYL